MQHVLRVLSSFMLITGLWLGWPLIKASTQLTRTREGRVLDVFSAPLPDGRVRMVIAFEFPIPGKPREIVLCFRQADRSFNLAEHLDLSAERAETLTRALPGQRMWVFYDVNDPAGTAFMVHNEPGHLRAEHGILLLLSGIACWLLSWFTRSRTPGG